MCAVCQVTFRCKINISSGINKVLITVDYFWVLGVFLRCKCDIYYIVLLLEISSIYDRADEKRKRVILWTYTARVFYFVLSLLLISHRRIIFCQQSGPWSMCVCRVASYISTNRVLWVLSKPRSTFDGKTSSYTGTTNKVVGWWFAQNAFSHLFWS